MKDKPPPTRIVTLNHAKVKTDTSAAAEIKKAQIDQIGASIRRLDLAAPHVSFASIGVTMVRV
jgi:hypothetical protein